MRTAVVACVRCLPPPTATRCCSHATTTATAAAGNRIDSDGVKLYCSVMATTVANRAIQVLGGYGYIGDYAVERLWRDAKLLEIGGGTLEAHHKNMTRDLSRFATLP